MSNKGLLKTLLQGLAILDYVGQHPLGVRNSQVAKEFGIDPAVSYRFLQTLTHAEYLHKEKTTYRLSCRLFSLVTASWSALIDLATPFLDTLADETGFTASISVLEGHSAYPLVLKQGKAPLVVNANLGKPVPLHASSLGKVLLAYLPSEHREQILGSIELRKLTPNTITNKKKLRQELAQIQTSGFAIDDEEYQLEVQCVAAPVLDQTGRAICALSVSYPAMYAASGDAFSLSLAEKIRSVAQSLSQVMGQATPLQRDIRTQK